MQTLAAVFLLPTVGAAQAQMAVSTAINRIARYRALSQRIAKAYAQMHLAVLPDQAASVMVSARKLVRSGFDELASVPWPAELANQVAEVHKSADALDALLVTPSSLQSVAAVAAQADRMQALADTATEAFEKSSKVATAKLVNLAGRQRALSQRLAKNYFLLATGGDYKGARGQLVSDAEEFRKAMVTLAAAPLSTPAIRDELALGDGQWLFFSTALQRKADARGLADVATTSERLLEVTDRLTNLYDAALKQVLG
ncbi:MAG: type IV pili methyl-accepting chemotaxis transducer N-terminal domain-containing protein [Giesbergeria sp.]